MKASRQNHKPINKTYNFDLRAILLTKLTSDSTRTISRVQLKVILSTRAVP